MPSVLTINGVDYDQSGRKASSLVVDGFGWDLDGDFWLEFHEYAAGYQPRFTGPRAVSYTDADEVLRFAGDIVGVQPGWSDEGRTWGYRCSGLKTRCNQIPVTGIDGSGVLAYNLRLVDEDYVQDLAGKSVGDILEAVLTLHATALGALGVSTDATTAAQLATMTLVPPDPVYVQGERLMDALDSILRNHQKHVRLVVLPSGLVRFVDVTAGTARTLTLGVDPVDPPLFSRDWSSCATRVVVRGRGKIAPANLSLSDETLVPAWDGTQQSNWKWADFAAPGDAYDKGAVTAVNGPTSITVASSFSGRTWPANFWNDRQAWIYLTKTTGTGLTYKEARPVTACSALSSGGTATITLGHPLENAGMGAFDEYELIGRVAQLGDDGLNNVWRLLNVVTPGGWVESHMVKQFPVPVPFVGINNASAFMTSAPVCMIVYQGNAFPATFRVLPETGQILFDRPIVETINQPQALEAGGSGINIPDDLIVLLPYSRGALEAPYPPDVAGSPQYAGLAYSQAGLERTRYADVDSWAYEGNYNQMADLAAMLHRSVCDTVVAGSVRYKGAYKDVWGPDIGHRLNIAAACGATGDEALNAPVRSVAVRLHWQGGGLLAETTMQVSTRRDPTTSEGYYCHLSQLGSGGMSGGFATLGGPMGPMGGGFAPPTFGAGGGFGLGGGGGGGRNTYRKPGNTQWKDVEKKTGDQVKLEGLDKWADKNREAERVRIEGRRKGADKALDRAERDGLYMGGGDVDGGLA